MYSTIIIVTQRNYSANTEEPLSKIAFSQPDVFTQGLVGIA